MSTSEPVAASPVSFREAWRFWLKLGFISFGGPAGQIALMHHELVERRRWISERRFLHAMNFCMLLPGPEAQQLATYLGWLMHRTWGGVIAGALFVLPSLLILIALSWAYLALGDNAVLLSLFYGIKPAVTAVIFHAAYRIGARTLRTGLLWAIALGALAAIQLLSAPFPAIVVGAALIGFVANRIAPQAVATHSSHATAAKTSHPAVIDDDTPVPDHARFSRRRLFRVLLAGALLWGLPMGALAGLLGWAHDLTQMGWFFTKAALLTFGGAYAVLPYVHQGAVEHYGWLQSSQMIDGLALGETTPGPLIMIVAFVGFLGGYGKALLGPDSLFLAGALAAVLVTWFTFLPSFLFIFSGGPLIESTHGQPALNAPLTAISAAVVGVIVNLALFFAGHVFWPSGPNSAFDLNAAIIAILAGIALFAGKRSVPEVIAGAAAGGLLLGFSS